MLPAQAGARSRTVDVPLYLVEHRAPDTEPQSQFPKRPVGVRDVRFALGSTRSRFVPFAPAGVWDGRGTHNPFAEGFEVHRNSIITNSATGTTRNKLHVSLCATGGAAVTPDNSGITGRTELLLGALRIAVGAHTQVTPERKIVLDVVDNDDPTGPVDGMEMWSSLPPAWGPPGVAKAPFSVLKKAPKNGTPAIELTLNAPVALKATLAKAAGSSGARSGSPAARP